MTAAWERSARRKDIVAVRLAAEGVPIGVIARGLREPTKAVRGTLIKAKQAGALHVMPAPDWPAVDRPTPPDPKFDLTEIVDLALFVRMQWPVTSAQAQIIAALALYPVASSSMLLSVSGSRSHIAVKVQITKARQALLDDRIAIGNKFGLGYFMTKTDRAKVLRMTTGRMK